MDKEIRPDILLVPSSLYKQADKILNAKILLEIGNYAKYQLRNEKPYWEKIRNQLEDRKKFDLKSVIRDGWDGYTERVERFSLPKAMRKRGYIIKSEYLGMGEYIKEIIKTNPHPIKSGLVGRRVP